MIHIGTSGWHYGHWRGPFYPQGLSHRRFFEHYCTHFGTVEVNNSFYRLPSEATVASWRDASPPGFVFAVKGSDLITHRKRLTDPEKTVGPFVERVHLFGEKLGPILFQLPPRFRRNEARLERFLAALPAGCRYAMEFRNPDWFSEGVAELLSRHGVAFCVFEFGDLVSPRWVTADFAYIRLHGPAGPYRGSYGEGALAEWASRIRGWALEGADVFCYFDNDEGGFAAQNAVALRNMIET